MKRLHDIAFIILILGGLNALLEVFDTGIESWAGTDADIFYVVIGLAAIVEIATHKRHCKSCEPVRS